MGSKSPGHLAIRVCAVCASHQSPRQHIHPKSPRSKVAQHLHNAQIWHTSTRAPSHNLLRPQPQPPSPTAQQHIHTHKLYRVAWERVWRARPCLALASTHVAPRLSRCRMREPSDARKSRPTRARVLLRSAHHPPKCRRAAPPIGAATPPSRPRSSQTWLPPALPRRE